MQEGSTDSFESDQLRRSLDDFDPNADVGWDYAEATGLVRFTSGAKERNKRLVRKVRRYFVTRWYCWDRQIIVFQIFHSMDLNRNTFHFLDESLFPTTSRARDLNQVEQSAMTRNSRKEDRA